MAPSIPTTDRAYPPRSSTSTPRLAEVGVQVRTFWTLLPPYLARIRVAKRDVLGDQTLSLLRHSALSHFLSLKIMFQCTNTNPDVPSECFVRYELEASLIANRSKIFSSGDETITRPLDFVTFRSILSPDPQLTSKTQTLACYSLRLQPGDEGLPLTFKEKLKSMRTSKLPVAFFKIHIQLPRVGVVGQPLLAFLRLDHDIERSTAPSPPIILLRKCSLVLQAFTFIQCIRDELLRDGDDQRDWDRDYHIASADFSEKMETAPAITECFDLRDVMRIKVPDRYKPTFSTFNIRRTYKLHLKVTVECAQKTFKVDFTTRDFVLLARDYMPSEGISALSSPNAMYDMEVAPVYQETLGPPPPSYGDPKMS